VGRGGGERGAEHHGSRRRGKAAHAADRSRERACRAEDQDGQCKRAERG
jgi:hypothetical protein